jgi:hypothetical protein
MTKGARWAPVALSIVLLLSVVALPARADECRSYDCDVVGNDELKAIEGRVLIPAQGYEGDPGIRREAATCDGCAWALTPSCAGNDENTQNGCAATVTLCPPPALRYDILRRRPGEAAFVFVGSTCIAPGTPLTVDDLTPRVRDHFLDLLPDQQPTFQPAAGALVNVPALFAAGQPRTIGRDTFDLAGFTVVLTADARWTWDFGDGSTQTYDLPGGPYPNDDVAHTYVDSQDRSVVVTTTWEGEFLVDGLGPFPVTGPPVSQVSPPILVPVRGARSELVAGDG